MPSNNSKYTVEIREQTTTYILKNSKSATRMAKELEIDKNTVCRWVRGYRRRHNLPSYVKEKGMAQKPSKSAPKLKHHIKELEKALKEKDQEIALQEKLLADEKEKVKVLKNPCTSSRNHKDEV